MCVDLGGGKRPQTYLSRPYNNDIQYIFMPLPVEPPPYLDLRDQGLYAINMNIKKLEQKLEDAETEWQAAFHNRVYLNTTVGKQQADQKRLLHDFENAP